MTQHEKNALNHQRRHSAGKAVSGIGGAIIIFYAILGGEITNWQNLIPFAVGLACIVVGYYVYKGVVWAIITSLVIVALQIGILLLLLVYAIMDAKSGGAKTGLAGIINSISLVLIFIVLTPMLAFAIYAFKRLMRLLVQEVAPDEKER